ncbi:MAG: hypothetical protein OEX22_00525 [Cyclobacteriaceae bacterium]|nr:hypothetical protein [Cyclobacteriaceae bacterium]
MMIYIIHAVILGSVIYWSYKKPNSSELSGFFFPAMLFKIVAGLGVGVLYFFYYEIGDTILYFEDAKKVSEVFYSSWVNYFRFLFGYDSMELNYIDNYRALLFVKLISPIVIFTQNNYWITSVYLSLMSFYTCWYLVLNINKYYHQVITGGVVAFLFFPSIVFWSSGVLKETISMSIIVVLSVFFIQIVNDEFKLPVRKVVLALLLVFLLFQLKYYYAAIFLIATLPTLIFKLFSKYFKIKNTVFIWLMLLLCFTVGVSYLHPNLSLQRVMDVVIANNKLYNQHVDLSKTIYYYNLENTLISIFINAPLALVSALFRPFVFEVGSVLQFMLGVENVFLVALFLVFPFRKIKIKKNEWPVILTCFTYIIVLAVLLALSTPNFGTLSRYRISFLPFLVVLLSYNNPLLIKFFGLMVKIDVRKT